MNVFIDCGAWTGKSTKFFKDNHPNSKDFKLYAFECNKKLKFDVDGVAFSRKAVWIHNQTENFYLGGKHSRKDFTESSSLIKEKKTGHLQINKPCMVECIDFSMWLKETFNKNDFIILKMNIEGAEYEVLNKMIDDNSIEYVNILHVQWHYNKINMDKSIHDELCDRLNALNIKISGWDTRNLKIIEMWK